MMALVFSGMSALIGGVLVVSALLSWSEGLSALITVVIGSLVLGAGVHLTVYCMRHRVRKGAK